jgi:DNA-binding transcriptional MerR regulator
LAATYRVREFAQLAGITSKTLRHYERVGLLKPGRSSAGYRLYTDRHLQRLEEILALKFLGLSLKEILAALERTPRELSEALRMQRQALLEKEARVRRAIRAIEAAERAIDGGEPAGTAALKKIIEVIQVQDAIEIMRRYYDTSEAWEKRKSYYEEGPGPEWRALYRDAAELLGQDPASEAVQALADRWLLLTVRAIKGDPAVQQDSGRAWMDREHWPVAMKARIAEFRLEDVTELIKRAALCARRKYFSEAAWTRVVEMRKQSGQLFPPTWQARVDLFRAIDAAMAECTAAEHSHRFANEWTTLFDVDSGGDHSVKEGLMRCWADRPNWSAVLRWREEGLHMMTGEQFDRVADFLDQAGQ